MLTSRENGAAAPSIARSFNLSLLTLTVSAAFTPAQAATSDAVTAADAPAEMVVSASADAAADGQDSHDYSVRTTRAGSKLLLTPRDVPQSVSIISQQRMQDQRLDTIGDVLNNTTGVAQYIIDSERVSYFSRGFYINNYTFDGIPTSVSDEWNFGDAAGDTATFDRIEVVRGATGLMTGAGNPGASVNMVRKRADAKTFSGALSASYGSWNRQRYVADVAGPLNEAGSVRGRLVAGYQDQDSWLDRYHKSKKFLYAVVDADVGDNTTLSLGYDYSDSSTRNPTWGGLPTWYSDGSRTRYDRSTNSAADWTHYYVESRKLLASASHDFSNGWNLRVNGTHSETTFDSKLLYSSGFPDVTSGEGMSGYGSLDKGKRRLDSVDSFASGPFSLFGRQHQLLAGVSYSRQRNVYYSADNADDVAAFGDGWDGRVAEPTWSDWSVTSDDVIRQKSAYGAVRFSLADPLSLILGARYTQYGATGTTAAMRKNNLTPYGGLVYDIDDTWSAYASYTSVFQPQSARTAGGSYLPPVTGKNYETGLKSAWFDGRLTATVSVFRIEQDNLAQADADQRVGDSSEQAYYAAKGVVSKGAEFELNGAVTDNLQMTFGAARYVAKDASGARPNAFAPQTTFKLFSSYTLPQLSALTVGGGIYWQDRTYQDTTGPSGDTQRVFQGSYPLTNLFARYQVTKQLGVQANVNNLFDRDYYAYTSDYAVYGEPRNVSVSMTYQF